SEGAHTASALVSYTDQFGTSHSWTSPPTSVTVTNALRIRSTSGDNTAFTPDGDGQEDTVSGSYQLSRDATVDITIENADHQVVRTLDNAVPHNAGWQNISWDGRCGDTPDSPVVPDGVYTVKISATDSAGNTDAASLHWEVVTVKPGTLALPAEGDTLNRVANFSFSPTSGVRIDQVSFCFNGWWWACTSTSTATADGTYRSSLETRNLVSDGPATVRTTAYWRDSFGTQ